MSNKRFEGTGVALVTPFDSNGRVDISALSRVVNHVIDGGVSYLVALGTTSEAPTLSVQEKNDVLTCIKEENSGRLPIVLGFGGNDTRALIESVSVTDFSGIDALLSVAPYYNKPTQEGIYQHFMELAKNSPKPIILYNVPGRTSSNISAETTLKLAMHEKIIGIKESSGSLDQCAVIASRCPDDFLLISGEDLHTLPIMSFGGKGAVSVLANALPQQFSQMVNAFRDGNGRGASEIMHKLVELSQLTFEEGNPAGIKSLLSRLDLCTPAVRLPLVKASTALSNKIAESVLAVIGT